MTYADDILQNAHAPIDPDVTAAARRYVVACGAVDCLAVLGLEDAVVES